MDEMQEIMPPPQLQQESNHMQSKGNEKKKKDEVVELFCGNRSFADDDNDYDDKAARFDKNRPVPQTKAFRHGRGRGKASSKGPRFSARSPTMRVNVGGLNKYEPTKSVITVKDFNKGKQMYLNNAKNYISVGFELLASDGEGGNIVVMERRMLASAEQRDDFDPRASGAIDRRVERESFHQRE